MLNTSGWQTLKEFLTTTRRENNPEERSSKSKHVAHFRHYKYCLKMLHVTDDVTFRSIRLSGQKDVPLYDTKL